MRRKVFAWVAGSNSRHLLILVERYEFAQGVQPSNYRLFQLADLVCSIHLIERRLEEGIPMTVSEMRLFGGPRDFKRNILKKIKTKEI